MQVAFNQEQVQLARSLQTFLDRNYDWGKRCAITSSGLGWRRDVWGTLADDLQILGAILPTRIGGSGGGFVDLMAIMHRLGRALVVEPFLETVVIGGGLLRHSGGSEADALLRQIVDGTARLSFAYLEPEAVDNKERFVTVASRSEKGWRIDGRKAAVAAAPMATHILIAARQDSGVSLFCVPSDHPGMHRHDYKTVDGKRASELYFTHMDLPDQALIGKAGEAGPIIDRVLDEASFAICAEAAGVLEYMVETTINYLNQREQFGSKLSSFQVLRHKVVDMQLALESVWSILWYAAGAMEEAAPVRAKATSAAKVVVGKACRLVGQNAIQLHGAIGVTEDLAVGHYFKRATMIELQFGTTAQHLSRYQSYSRPHKA